MLNREWVIGRGGRIMDQEQGRAERHSQEINGKEKILGRDDELRKNCKMRWKGGKNGGEMRKKKPKQLQKQLQKLHVKPKEKQKETKQDSDILRI